MKDIKYEFKTKLVPTTYITIDGEEYCLADMYAAIGDMLDTEEDDEFGDYSYRDYDLSVDKNYYNCLIKLGLVKNFTGPRQANCFCVAKGAKKSLEKFLERLDNDYIEWRKLS